MKGNDIFSDSYFIKQALPYHIKYELSKEVSYSIIVKILNQESQMWYYFKEN